MSAPHYTILYSEPCCCRSTIKPVDRILVIDDDVELCSLVGEYLAPEGFQVESAADGTRGLEQALNGEFLLVVLDVMLPGLNGFEVLRRLRDKSRIPVLLLTARGEDVDRIVGLEIGADDYLPKPFNPRELVARIRAILRRTRASERSGSGQPSEILRVGEVELDPATRTVLQKGKQVEFTSVEFNLLHVLLREAGRVVPRERLVDIVLSRKFSPFDRSIDMHVSKIRKKLGDSDSGVDHIKTVRGVGYIFTRPQEVAAEKVKAHEKSFSQDFSFVLDGAGALPGARHIDYDGPARARRVGRLGRAAIHRHSTRRSRLTNKAAPRNCGSISRKFATRCIPGPTCWMIREKKFPATTCRAGRSRWQRVSDQRLATFGSV